MTIKKVLKDLDTKNKKAVNGARKAMLEANSDVQIAIKLITDKRDKNLAAIEKLKAENAAIDEALNPSFQFKDNPIYVTDAIPLKKGAYYKDLGDKYIATAKYNGAPWTEFQINALDQYIASGGKDLKLVAAKLGRTPFACFMKAARRYGTLCEGTVYELWASAT